MARTPEATLKAITTKRQKAESVSGQTVVIDKDWTIQRVDPLNWEIRYQGQPQGFYSTIVAAMRVLPAKMLSEEAKGNLADVVAQQKAIIDRIEAHFPV